MYVYVYYLCIICILYIYIYIYCEYAHLICFLFHMVMKPSTAFNHLTSRFASEVFNHLRHLAQGAFVSSGGRVVQLSHRLRWCAWNPSTGCWDICRGRHLRLVVQKAWQPWNLWSAWGTRCWRCW